MRKYRLRSLLGCYLLLTSVCGFAAEGEVAGKVADLAWMSGHWEGPMGNDGAVLEENWAQPKGATIASLVRNFKGKLTAFVELIVIEEVEGSLVLHLEQWDPGYKSRSVWVMKLAELGKNKVRFKAVGDIPVKTLGYRREGTKFTISGTTAQGPFEIPLTGKGLNP